MTSHGIFAEPQWHTSGFCVVSKKNTAEAPAQGRAFGDRRDPEANARNAAVLGGPLSHPK